MTIEIDHHKINQVRSEKGITVSIFMLKSKISKAEVYKIINGERKEVYESTALKIAKALNCDYEHFARCNQE